MGYNKMMRGLLVSMLVLVLGFSGCTSWLHSAVIGENEGLKRHPTKSAATVYEDTLPLTALAGSPKDSEIEPIQTFLSDSPPYPNLTQGERSGEVVEGSQSSGLQSIFTQSPDSNSQNQEFGNGGQFGRGDIVAGLVGEDLIDRFQDSDSGLDQKEITDIFFDFDQAFIREDARSVLETNAELLTTR